MRMTAWMFIAFIAIITLIFTQYNAWTAEPPTVDITIYNPYSLTVNIEVKCDYDRLGKKFLFQRHIIIKGKGATRISVPKHHKRCQIWPHIEFF